MVKDKNSVSHQDFYDLEDLQLNIDPISNQRLTSWGNLGYWKQNRSDEITKLTYPKACEQLAIQLAQCATLDQLPDTHVVLDTGFGCGDQLAVWHAQYSVNCLYGINYSQSQTEFALHALNKAGIAGFTLKQGDCCEASSWHDIPKPIDRIIALDCVYHFQNKPQYLNHCAKYLASDGVLAISDLQLTKPLTNPLHKLMLRLICKLSHIPFSNLMTQEDASADLLIRGLKLDQVKDVTDAVFLPFGDWLSEHIKLVKNVGVTDQKLSWFKYESTAKFLRWAYRHQILSYRLLQIRKA